MIGALLQHPLDVRGKRHIGQQLTLEQFLAVVRPHFGKLLADIGELDVAALDFREAEHLLLVEMITKNL